MRLTKGVFIKHLHQLFGSFGVATAIGWPAFSPDLSIASTTAYTTKHRRHRGMQMEKWTTRSRKPSSGCALLAPSLMSSSP